MARIQQKKNIAREIRKELEQREIIPTGIVIDAAEMNNYMLRSEAFAQDDSFVYFDDNFYVYALNKENGQVEKTLLSSLESYKSFYYSAMIAEGTAFSYTGEIWKIEDPKVEWRICSRIAHEDANLFTYSNGPVIPYGDYIYYLYIPSSVEDEDAMILRGSINSLHTMEQSAEVSNSSYGYLELPEADIVFQEYGLESFGIYNNYIVAMTENSDIWVIDIESGTSNRVVKGEEIRRTAPSKHFAVDGEYIYFTNDNEEKVERILFDGTARETVLNGLSGAGRDLFNCAEGYLYHIDCLEEGGEYYLFRTDLKDSTSRIILATGDSEGISPASEPKLYIMDDWVYYQSVTSGYWRSKIDGSCAELLTYAATDEKISEWNPEMVKQKSIAVGYRHTVALKSDGTVVAIGDNENGECNVSDWEDIISVYASQGRTIGLKADGSVCVAGMLYTNESLSALSNTVDMDVDFGVIVGIKADGQAVGVGVSSSGATIVEDWNDIVAISTSGSHTVGVKSDGTVLAVGDNRFGQCDVSGWTNIVDVATSGMQTVGLKSDGTVITTLRDEEGNLVKIDWTEIVSVEGGGNDILGIREDGTVVTTGGQDFSDWTDIVDIAYCNSHIIGLKSDGTLVAEGSELYGMCDVGSWNNIKLPNF